MGLRKRDNPLWCQGLGSESENMATFVEEGRRKMLEGTEIKARRERDLKVSESVSSDPKDLITSFDLSF